ncbi:CRISPR-associated endonuclease Cas2 [Thermochromatium tepidum]|jgi:CRISPR-associated protein Cas2|uniref:CRISPR-associated endoribonuclease Cas2 n=1 Tax=Thermochromatium tepidum ATCC 43061 TaxID=316276 RepID=A0A6I6E302_THETI|nr:CRISPR-associated endonuclease Cas2 [Thermochromatium tepidum]QGU32112.1 CRISPR-associated endonuclease Cas2 [Thermochromatium tepidum ATCC 43061]
MSQCGWYLLAYDIADPRRLQRLHRAVRREGIALQRSVFLVQGTESAIEALIDRLEALMDVAEDDLRAYPVAAPSALWLRGQCVVQGHLLGDGEAATAESRPSAPGWRTLTTPTPPLLPFTRSPT